LPLVRIVQDLSDNPFNTFFSGYARYFMTLTISYDQLTVYNAPDGMTNTSTLYDLHDHFISSDDHDTITL